MNEAAVAPSTRLDGWQDRVKTVLDAARDQPYQLGTNDCLRLACATIHALIGVDHWPRFEGQYSTKLQALRLIAEYGGDFKGGAAKLFGGQAEPMERARPGDIAEYRARDLARTPHLGIVWNHLAVAILSERGMIFVPRAHCWHCWRIG